MVKSLIFFISIKVFVTQKEKKIKELFYSIYDLAKLNPECNISILIFDSTLLRISKL